MKNIKILSIVLGAVLILSVVNIVSIMSLNNTLNVLTGNIISDTDNTKLNEIDNDKKNDADIIKQVETAPTPSDNKDLMASLIDDDEIKGDSNAPVTIIEWGDFECPFCGRFYSQTLSQIDSNYIETGKVKLVYRDFPLSFHANAQKSAEAAECAGEQGKYWEMHDKLFESGVSGGVNSFKQYAKELGLSSAEFDDCLDSGIMEQEVKKDMQDGGAAGITGTPGFIINGVLISGAQPYNVFKQVIDAELAK